MLKDKSLIFVHRGTVLDNVTKKPIAILAKLQGSCVQMVESSSTSTIWPPIAERKPLLCKRHLKAHPEIVKST